MAIIKTVNSQNNKTNSNQRRARAEIDTTGRRHIFQIRGGPYQISRRTNASSKSSDTNEKNSCKRCVISEQLLNIFDTRLAEIQTKIDTISGTQRKLQSNQNFYRYQYETKFSRMNIDDLIKLSAKIGN
ncbi:506_t:CDS:1 [Ambispora gerdemannii]|uniref:506_t:CDS:1 n=1 Tax=Ambispora gerdemannii TaxID=144530 RepID=A0A9N9CS98_9GLOM|nr:506_t:CDS:1 [Ambispora gerdemannii]